MYNAIEIIGIIALDILIVGVLFVIWSWFDKFIKRDVVDDEEDGELSPFWEKIIKITPIFTIFTYIGIIFIGYLITADTLTDNSLTLKETFEKLNVLYTGLTLVTLIHLKSTGNPFKDLIKQEG